MNVEWDEELVERAFEPWAPAFVGRHREEGCGNWCHEGGNPEHAFMLLGLMAESANTARLEAEAERDAERSLREDYQIRLAFRSGDVAHLKAERDALAEKISHALEMLRSDNTSRLRVILAETVLSDGDNYEVGFFNGIEAPRSESVTRGCVKGWGE